MSIITTTKTYGPYLMSYTSEGKVTITQQPSAHPLLVTPMVTGPQDARTIAPIAIMPGKEQTSQYRRDMELATRAAGAFARSLADAGVEGLATA